MAQGVLFYTLGVLHAALLSGGYLLRAPRAAVDKPTVCETKACHERAQLILSSIDKSRDPCEDFYSYVCARNITETEGTGPEYNHVKLLDEDYGRKLKVLLDSLPNVTEAKNATEKLAVAYHVCLYSDLSLENEIEETKIAFAQRGWAGWPIIKTQEPAGKRFNTFEEFVLAVGLETILDVSPAVGPGKGTSYMIKVKPISGILGVDLNAFVNHPSTQVTNGNTEAEIRGVNATTELPNLYDILRDTRSFIAPETFKSHVEELKPVSSSSDAEKENAATRDPIALAARSLKATLALFNRNASQEELADVWKSIMNILRGIAKIPPRGRKETKTIKEVESAIPGFPLLQVLNKLLKPAGVQMEEDESIVLEDYDTIVATMKYFTTEPPDDVFNTIVMMQSFKLLIAVSEVYRQVDAVKKYMEVLHINVPRWVYCVNQMTVLLPEVITRLYVKKYFDHSKKPAATSLLNAIGKSYYQHLAHIPWMDYNTWKNASHKLWEMRAFVAYSDTVMNEQHIEEKFKNVTNVRRNSAFATIVQQMLTNQRLKGYRLLRRHGAESGFEYPFEQPSAAYFAPENSVGVLSGILQGIFFHEDLPMVVNLAAVGFIMAHEITHAFDNLGKDLDAHGRFFNWWSNYTMDAYLEKARCFVSQYGGIRDKLTNMTLDGQQTLSENIADNAGVRVAFATLRNMLRDYPVVTLPGLEELSSEQLFFISFALPWCANVTSGSLATQIRVDEHAPLRYRVNVPLMNTLEFSTAFNCKRGSPMRLPDNKRCSLW